MHLNKKLWGDFMKKNYTFCENCQKDIKYKEYKKVHKEKLKGKIYLYQGYEASCPICNNNVFVWEHHDFNLDALWKAYREENKIVSQSIIDDLPKKYNIGKRPLSTLLNWGELTYTRYIDGLVPSKKYSDEIIKLYNNPKYYLEILEKNKNKIEDITYKKSRLTLNKILNINEDKIFEISEYLIYKSNFDITPLAIQKLLYYCQGFYYALYNSCLFIDDCQAWIYGPVYKNLYDRFKTLKYNPIPKKEIDLSKYSKKEKEFLNQILRCLGCFSGEYLRAFTHLEKPWKQTRKGLNKDATCTKIIKKELIFSYFKDVVKQYDIKTPDEIAKYSLTMFKNVIEKN